MNEKSKKRVVIKVQLPKNLKLLFKVICTQKNLTMSDVLEELIEKWIQADVSTNNFISEPTCEEDEALKGYIAESLKTSFKISCIQKGMTMRHVLYNLIHSWIKVEYNCELTSHNNCFSMY